MSQPFFTIGHSTRPIEEFIGLLRRVDVELVIDVRTVPRSRRNPQFEAGRLAKSLADCGIGYARIAELGGLRPKSLDVLPEVNAFWTNDGFHNYADYAMSEPFRCGLAALRGLGREQRCAIMCAEALWWRCHRRIITDYSLAAGERVFHILDVEKVKPAEMTPAARMNQDGSLTYPSRL